jgi:D-amino-acid dehydrogenase
MTERYDTAVVGGGIVGASVSYHLARKGVETLLIDRNDDGRATDAGAGVISPATSSRTGDDGWFDFATDAVAYYPELNAQLERRGAGETSYRRQGTIAAAIDSDEIEPYEEAVRRIDERGLDSIEEIDPEAASPHSPNRNERSTIRRLRESMAGRSPMRCSRRHELTDSRHSIRTSFRSISGTGPLRVSKPPAKDGSTRKTSSSPGGRGRQLLPRLSV